MYLLNVSSYYNTEENPDFFEFKSNPSKFTKEIFNDKTSFINYFRMNKKNLIYDGILTLDGGIKFTYNNKSLIDETYWDDLPTLWAYLLNVMEDYYSNGRGKTYFPTQPIEVRLESINNKLILLVIDGIKMKIDYTCIDILLNEAEMFFKLLVHDLNLTTYGNELTQIDKIRKKI